MMKNGLTLRMLKAPGIQKVTDGEYVFKVRAFNADGVIGEYAQFSFQIRKPFWKSWWFYVAVFVVIIVSFVLNHKHKEKETFLEDRNN